MFERLRFYYRFYRNYRSARKAGQDHESALDQATHQTMEDAAARDGSGDAGEDTRQFIRGVADVAVEARRGNIGEDQIEQAVAGVFAAADSDDASDGPVFSGKLREQWCNGETHYVAHHGLEIESYDVARRALDVTPAHLSLIRRMRFSWDEAEVGAPMLDTERPYGERDLLAQMEQVFGETSEAGQLARHVEMMIALNHFLMNASLAPGDYALANISPDDLRDIFEAYEDDICNADVGLTAEGMFRFTDEHAALIRCLSLEWSDADENEFRLDCGQYPGLAFDPKRPYGAMSYFQLDMAEALGVLPQAPDDDLPDDLEERLGRLHWQMLGALQVFVVHAEFAPGRYGFS